MIIEGSKGRTLTEEVMALRSEIDRESRDLLKAYADIERLKGLLLKHGQHDPFCTSRCDGPCVCGFREALALAKDS